MPISSSLTTQLATELPQVTFVTLVTIEHSSLPAPLRLCNQWQNFTSRGETYLAYPMLDAGFAEERESRIPRAGVVMEDVDQAIVAALRSLDPRDPPTVTVELVTAEEPNTVQPPSLTFEMRSAQGDGATIEAEVTAEHLVGLRAPGYFVTPYTAPGRFP